MRDLERQFGRLCDRNKEGKFKTQVNRLSALKLMSHQLRLMGYKDLKHPREMGNRHVFKLVELWREGGYGYKPLAPSTIHTRLAYLRWALRKADRGQVMGEGNSAYWVAHRQPVPTESKAQELDLEKLSQIEEPYTVFSLRLQAAFGLRKAEAIKFNLSYAYERGADHINIKSSWARTRQDRRLPVETDSQRILLDEITRFAGQGSLIPPDMTFRQQKKRWESECRKAGLSPSGGLRHHYVAASGDLQGLDTR